MTTRQLLIAERSLKCLNLTAALVGQTCAAIGMLVHFKMELRIFWLELRQRLQAIWYALMPPEVKRVGRMWDDIEEVMRLCNL